MIYGLEKMIKDSGDKLAEEDKKKLQDAIEEAKKQQTSEDLDAIKKAIEDLTNTSNGIVSKMYQNASAAAGADANNGGNNGGNNGEGPDPEVVVDEN